MQYDENAEKYGYEGEMTPMKCDELKAYKGDVYIPVYGSIADADVYLKKDADTAIAELKDIIHELQVDLEGAKATAYAESVDAGMRERRLKRALWIARAKTANEAHFMWCQLIYDKKYGLIKFNVKKEWGENVKQGQTLHTPQGWADVWDDVERKCLKKAEEFK